MNSLRQLAVGPAIVELVRGDITCIEADAIVNAANSALAGGGGVDGAIHRAGGPEIMRQLSQYDGCPTGSAVVTGAGKLPARFVIHAVGPVYRDGRRGEPELLASCYASALKLSDERQCNVVSFPSISTGIYGYPLAEAAEVALAALAKCLPDAKFVRTVKLVQFSDEGFAIYERLFERYTASAARAQGSAQTS